MLEQLINRVHRLMKAFDNIDGIIDFSMSLRFDNKYPTYEFTHYIDGMGSYKKFKEEDVNIFCDRVTKYLDELEAANYQPKFKVGDILKTSPHDNNSRSDIRIIHIEEGNYVFKDLGYEGVRFHANYELCRWIEKHYILKE